jgi:D-alanyl-D-alanine carboxypeptidase
MTTNTVVRKNLVAALLVAALLAVPPACSDNTPAGPLDSTVDGFLPPDTGADQSTAPDLVAPDAGRPAACLDQDTKLQAALDAVRTSPNAMIVVRNDACGTTVYISGDSATATQSSLWRIGSKTYLAATILTLVREGKLSLDDPLSKWVANVPKTDGVTIKMLLNHTSGIFDCAADPTFLQDLAQAWTPAELVALATTHDPYFAPGTGWHGSNTNYILLGMILEKAGGAKASALIRQRVLEPAGLKETFFEGAETLQGTLATGFDKDNNDITHTYSLTWSWPAMAATGAGLCNGIHALLATTKVLTLAERTTMLDAVDVSSSNEIAKAGLGVGILDPSTTYGAGPGQGTAINLPDFRTRAFWFPDKQTAICSAVNQNSASAFQLIGVALKVLFGS